MAEWFVVPVVQITRLFMSQCFTSKQQRYLPGILVFKKETLYIFKCNSSLKVLSRVIVALSSFLVIYLFIYFSLLLFFLFFFYKRGFSAR